MKREPVTEISSERGAVESDGDDDGEFRLRPVERVVIDGEGASVSGDRVVCEEPLEIRIGGVPLAVVMRTPGNDVELTRGFLLTERIVAGLDWIESVRHCTDVEHPEAEDNVMQVVLRRGVVIDLARLRRNLYASSSCGICGKATIENVLATAPPVDDECSISAATLTRLPDLLRAGQPVFDRTGGLHAAGLFTTGGDTVVVREDIGRHNAVDKVVGWALAGGAGVGSLQGHALMVSGRISYEIVQKALAARIPIVAAVSAPSSLAIELANAGRMTLVAFLRGGRMSIYSGRHRVV